MGTNYFKEAELDRLLVIQQIKSRSLSQREAGEELGISTRQIRRLLRREQSGGAAGIKARHKGGNRAFEEAFKEQVLQIVAEKYSDFGPTFASEKLACVEGLIINKETLRQWMMSAGHWKGRSRKRACIHQSRERRPRLGELVQIDGSYHDWFEGRAAKCCLLVFIDDATSKIVGLHFVPSETTQGYLHLVQQHLLHHGRPVAYYSDKHSIFKTSREQCVDGLITDTQLHRALRTLGIELICAHSSQAKGRVERANQTLQDRLVKELRLRQIASIDAANAYLPEFIADFNRKFSVQAAHPEDAHRPLHHDKAQLRRILSVHTQRKLSKNLEFSLNGIIHQIITPTTGYRLRHTMVTICEHADGSTEVLAGDAPLQYRRLSEKPRVHEADTKQLNLLLDQLVRAATHPAATTVPAVVPAQSCCDEARTMPVDRWTESFGPANILRSVCTSHG